MTSALPPGPRWPKTVQTVAWWSRSVPFFERCRARYGKRFTIRLVQQPDFVHLTDPDEIRELFQAPPDVLHPGEGAAILEPIVGKHSLILLDEDPHLEQRKLMLPAFHGERMQRLEGLMREVAEREAASWPQGDAVALHPRLQALTLDIILRAVFGLEEGERLDVLRTKLTRILELGAEPAAMMPALQFGKKFKEFVQLRDDIDAHIFELVAERRAEGEQERDDVLSMLLLARHEDDTPMTRQELRDELMTLLVAGHETTASELAWAFERLVHEPVVLQRLVDEIDRDGDDAYLAATVTETLRRRPVLPNAEPRKVVKPIDIGGWHYEPGPALAANVYLVHHDADIYPEPYAFRPERFLEEKPGTYTWIPYGGGRRRCIGASFATLEMKIVLRAVLERHELRAASGGLELTRRRSITLSPGRGATTVLRERIAPAPGERMVEGRRVRSQDGRRSPSTVS